MSSNLNRRAMTLKGQPDLFKHIENRLCLELLQQPARIKALKPVYPAKFFKFTDRSFMGSPGC